MIYYCNKCSEKKHKTAEIEDRGPVIYWGTNWFQDVYGPILNHSPIILLKIIIIEWVSGVDSE